MPQSQPYQPLVLRLLHGLNGILVIIALITGFLVYDSYDGRFGRLGLTQNNRSLIDLHGTVAFALFFVFIAFAIYCVRPGQKRLIQANSWHQLTQFNRPVWWYTLHRIANTIALLAVTLAVVSGKLQDENWLPQGQLDHFWYSLHLIAWVGVGLAILLHILMGVKVGGLPLLLSMINPRYKEAESPKLWGQKIRAWLRHPRL